VAQVREAHRHRRGSLSARDLVRGRLVRLSPTAPTPISERLRDYLDEFSPVVGITPETITADQVPRWERVAAMVLPPGNAREGTSLAASDGSASAPLSCRRQRLRPSRAPTRSAVPMATPSTVHG
jgi:hypothetical protein